MKRAHHRASISALAGSLVVMLLVIAARPGQGPAMAPSQTVATSPAASRSDSVRVGCFGGIAARGSGNVVTREGALSSYEKQLQTPATYTFLRRDSAAAALVFAELDRIRFRTLRFNEIRNMTCILELSDANGKHDVTWEIGGPPPELKRVLAALTRLFGDQSAMWARGIQ
jgi:hypothetical protein